MEKIQGGLMRNGYRLLLFFFISAFALTPRIGWANSALPVLLAQPGVFQVAAYGDVEARIPASFSLNKQALQAEFLRSKTEGSLGDLTEAQFYWRKIADDPDAYLKASPETKKGVLSNINYLLGSAFAISEEGVFLTNAHVLRDVGNEVLDENAFRMILAQPLEANLEQLWREFSGGPIAADARPAEQSVLHWIAARTRVKIAFKSARVTLRYFPANPGRSASGIDLFDPSSEPSAPRLVHIPVRVIAKGEPWPGIDVAVLKAEPDSLKFLGRDDGDPRILAPGLHLICVPLGDSGSVVAGTHVHALGFPGVAFSPAEMSQSARFVVNSQPGELGQPIEMKSGWSAFPLSAVIEHGDSGGPVINDKGEAIAINVAGYQAGYSFAIPINLARTFLQTANITPNCGLDLDWKRAVQLFLEEKFADAANAAERIARRQAGLEWGLNIELGRDLQNPKIPSARELALKLNRYLTPKGHTDPGVSPYVLELEDKAVAHLAPR